MAKSLWNIGTPENPVIQGQDGLPFYHQPGGWIRYGSNSASYSYVNNYCLCNCKSYLYYVNYIHLGNQKRRVFKSNSQGDYIQRLTSNSISGYAFNQPKLMCIPVYLPKGTFKTGISQVPDLPYSQHRLGNITRPCPQYYRDDSPFDAATTIRRYINTYGSSDCGVPVSDSFSISGSGSGSNCQWYWAEYYVQDLNYSDVDPYVSLIEGSVGHSKKLPPPVRAQMLDCHTARVLTRLFSCSDSFNYSNSIMKNAALSRAQQEAQQHTCTNWALFRIDIPCCSSNSQYSNWQRAYADGTPDNIWGMGDGEGLQNWHTTQKVYVKLPSSVSVYQWVAQSLQPPAPIIGNPCNQICSQYYGWPSDSSSSGVPVDTDLYIECSSSGSSCSTCPQSKPCNIMKDFPYFYKAADTQFPLFDIWHKQPSDSWEKLYQGLNDWDLLPQWDGEWTKVYKDQNNNIVAIQILVDQMDQNSDGSLPAWVQQERMRKVWQEEDAQNFYLSHYTYWQFYFQCDTKFGVCGSPRAVERDIFQEEWEDIAQQHGVCLGKWQLANHNNTFTSQQQPLPGLFVYTLQAPSDVPQVCYELNKGASSISVHGSGKYSGGISRTIQFPKKYLQMQVTTVGPGYVLRQDPLYISSQIQNYDLLFSSRYSSDSVSNLKCTFEPIPQGWYQQPRGQQGEVQLDTKYWKDALPSQKLVGAHYQDGILTPGRKVPAQGQQQGDAICNLYYIQLKSYGWLNAVASDSRGLNCSDSRYIVQQIGASGQPIQLELPSKINWQRDCAKTTPYGLKVYIIGPYVFPGVVFDRCTLPAQFWPPVAGMNQAFMADGEELLSYEQSSSQTWRNLHGNETIASGFYYVRSALKQSWKNGNTVIFPPYMTRQTFPSSTDCAQWDLSTSSVVDPNSGYGTMCWRIYIAFGYQNGLNRIVNVHGIRGKSKNVQRKVGFRLNFGGGTICSNSQPAVRLRSSSDSKVVSKYFRNVKPSIQAAADTDYFVWPGDSNNTAVTIPTGFLVPDPKGTAVFGKKLSSRGVVTGEKYYWRQSIHNQSYGASDLPWWIFAATGIKAYKNLPSGCSIASVPFIEVEQRSISSKKHARLSSNLTQDGKVYVEARMPGGNGSPQYDLGDSGIRQIYAAPYLINGQHDAYDSYYAWKRGTWQSDSAIVINYTYIHKTDPDPDGLFYDYTETGAYPVTHTTYQGQRVPWVDYPPPRGRYKRRQKEFNRPYQSTSGDVGIRGQFMTGFQVKRGSDCIYGAPYVYFSNLPYVLYPDGTGQQYPPHDNCGAPFIWQSSSYTELLPTIQQDYKQQTISFSFEKTLAACRQGVNGKRQYSGTFTSKFTSGKLPREWFPARSNSLS